MAHAARLVQLVQGLTTSITGRSDTAQCKQIIKQLREHSFPITNQFAVKASFNGLHEKFCILDREDLAEAIQERLDKLSLSSDEHLHDKLALLLKLSDLPHRRLGAQLIENNAETLDKTLTWAEIIKDDPLNEVDLWDNIERGYHSSGDEDNETSEKSSYTGNTSIDDDIKILAQAQLLAVPDRPERTSTPSTELKLVREVLFMLYGLPSEIFVVDHRSGQVFTSTVFNLYQTTALSTKSVIDKLTIIGSSLNLLRGWADSSHREAHIRSCQAIAQSLLKRFNEQLAGLQKQYMTGADAVVSILRLMNDIEEQARPLLGLSAIVRKSSESTTTANVLLDHLYEAACDSQASNQYSMAKTVLEVLQAGLRTYIRPLQYWCCNGAIDTTVKNPLILEVGYTMATIWIERFVLRPPSEIPLPTFMTAFAERIFILGKNRMFQREVDSAYSYNDHGMDIDFGSIDVHSLQPLQYQMNAALTTWLDKIASGFQRSLVQSLISDHNLLDHINTMHDILLGKNGAAYSNLVELILQHAGRNGNKLPSSLVLSRQARNEFDSTINRYSKDMCTLVNISAHGSSILQRVGDIELDYAAPWYVSNVVDAQCMLVLRRVSTLLLQLHTSKKILQPICLKFKSNQDCTKNKKLGVIRDIMIFADTLLHHVATVCEALTYQFKQNLQQTHEMDSLIRLYQEMNKGIAIATMTSDAMEITRAKVIDILDLAEALVRLDKGNDSDRVEALSATHISTYSALLERLQVEANRENNQWLKDLADTLASLQHHSIAIT